MCGRRILSPRDETLSPGYSAKGFASHNGNQRLSDRRLLCRRDAVFSKELKDYLFTAKPITDDGHD